MKDLLRTSDLTPNDLTLLLDLADTFKHAPLEQYQLLTGKTVVLYFAKPSTRTRLSFETAVAHLGGIPSTVGPSELQIGRGETLEDTAKVVSRYAEAFVIRTYADDDVHLVASAASIPVINALTDGHHPCQSLADLLTLRQHWGTLKGKKLAYVGAGNNVLHSLLEAAALAGMTLHAATPADYAPDPVIVAGAQAIAAQTGATLHLTTDPYEAAWDAEAVYTDAWVSMGDSDATRAARFAALTPYRVTTALMGDVAAPGAIFLHCLPAHRGEEVTAEVLDGPQSVVFDQAENRLHTGQAVLYALLTGALQGSATQPVDTIVQLRMPVAQPVHHVAAEEAAAMD
jgi:ornithine carbamoyltransferase